MAHRTKVIQFQVDEYITGTVATDNYNPLTSLVCYITYIRHHSIVGQIPPPPSFSPPLLEKIK